MTIHVTPIPKLVSFATPAITIGATAAAGDALTAIRSNSTIAGIALVASTVDNSIARYSGTGGQLQGYTSAPPLISDAGVITLASGQLTFPATQAASAGANTLDDYEEGTWTPALADDDLNGSAEGQGYSVQVGRYTKIGNRVYYNFRLLMTSIGSLTTSQQARIVGLPFTSNSTANNGAAIGVGYASDIAVTAGVNISGEIDPNTSNLRLWMYDASTGINLFTCGGVSADGAVRASGHYEV